MASLLCTQSCNACTYIVSLYVWRIRTWALHWCRMTVHPNLKLFIWFWGIQGLGVRPIRASVAARCGLVSSGKVLAYQRQLDSYWLKFWRLGLSKKLKWSLCHSFSLKQLRFAIWCKILQPFFLPFKFLRIIREGEGTFVFVDVRDLRIPSIYVRFYLFVPFNLLLSLLFRSSSV